MSCTRQSLFSCFPASVADPLGSLSSCPCCSSRAAFLYQTSCSGWPCCARESCSLHTWRRSCKALVLGHMSQGQAWAWCRPLPRVHRRGSLPIWIWMRPAQSSPECANHVSTSSNALSLWSRSGGTCRKRPWRPSLGPTFGQVPSHAISYLTCLSNLTVTRSVYGLHCFSLLSRVPLLSKGEPTSLFFL